MPWIRLSRHESYENEDWTERQKMFTIDVVHRNYFETYLEQHLLPFAKKLAKKILKHDTIIASGKAFAKGMGKNSWNNID